MKEKRVHLFISGRVQGVFFRDNARKKAEALKLKGWVKNLEDGRVEIEIEGYEENVEAMIKWAEKGPLLARVDNLEIKREEYKGEFNSFEIIRR